MRNNPTPSIAECADCRRPRELDWQKIAFSFDRFRVLGNLNDRFNLQIMRIHHVAADEVIAPLD
jgi:hypothetical protein